MGDPDPSDAQRDPVVGVLSVGETKCSYKSPWPECKTAPTMLKHKSHTNLIDMQKVFDSVSTLLLCVQQTQLTNKVTDLLTVPALHTDHSF